MVNKEVLSFLESNMDELVEAGLLMPPFLASVNPSLVRRKLQRIVSTGPFKGGVPVPSAFGAKRLISVFNGFATSN